MSDLDILPPARSERHNRPKRRWLKRLLLILLALVLLVVAGVGGYLGFLNHVATSNIKQDDLLVDENPTGGPAPTTDAAGETLITGRGLNYLFIGSDSRGSDRGRSDVIVLMHIQEDNQKVYLVHFPRDLYVDIPGHGKNKINASYAYGGAPLLVQTLQNLVGIQIDHVALTNFDGFKGMTDAVGGVRVWAEEGSNGGGNGGPTVIKKGWNDLNGEQALAFVRERYTLSEGDISRGKRQQAFIKALMLKATSKDVVTNPVKVANFVDAATKNLTVDKSWTVASMRGQAVAMRDIRGDDISFITAPFSGFASIPGAGDVDLVNEAGMSELRDSLRNDTLASYADQHVTP